MFRANTWLPFAGFAVIVVACGGCLPSPPPEPADESAPPVADVPFEQVPAKAGVGKQGRQLDGKSGMLVTPVQILFDTRQRVIFEIQIPQALALYQAEHGHPPKTEDEFMKQIVEANHLQLPELPDGHTYIYDAEAGQLMVRRPVDPQAADPSSADDQPDR
jgi:hypothetical protein